MTNKPTHTKPEKGDPPSHDLVPPDSREDDVPRTSGGRGWFVFAGGVVLVLGALFVLLLPILKGPIAVAPDPPQVTKPAVAQPQVPVEQEASMELESVVDGLLDAWLRKKVTAEAENVANWQDDRYVQALELADNCNRYSVEKQYADAQAACDEAIRTLDELVAAKEGLLADAITAGWAALDRGDPEAAGTAFSKALAIDPQNNEAAAGRQRAEKLPEVLALVAEGNASESEGQLEAARERYSSAVSIDSDYSPARAGLSRVSGRISEQKFRQAMSRALQAFESGQLDRSASALQEAARLKPNDPAVRDLRQQLSGVRRTNEVDRLRQLADASEQDERWAEVLKACEEALGVDPQLAFAISCRDRARQRLALENELLAVLAKPEKLFSNKALQSARRSLEEARRVIPMGPVLTSQVEKVAALIVEAETEVEVVLQSDNLTEVAIFHVGRLGRFQEKRLVLRTGDYTATGSRVGFRDVRQTLKVRPGRGSVTFRVQCEEPI